MNKILLSKKFGIAITILTFVLGTLSYFNLAFKPSYVITQNDQSVVITLPNGQYFILRPEADYIQEPNGNTFRPFGGINTRNFEAKGIDFFVLRRSYVQEIKHTDNIRKISVNPVDSTSFDLNYSVFSNLYYGDTSIYIIQIDYSKDVEFKTTEDSITINDSSCSIEFIYNSPGKITKLEQYASFILTQNYSDLLNFELKVNINCTE